MVHTVTDVFGAVASTLHQVLIPMVISPLSTTLALAVALRGKEFVTGISSREGTPDG